MIELLVVGAVLGGLGVFYGLALLPWDLVLGGGLLAMALGLVVGLPAGFYYHVQLRRALAPSLPERWWLRPASFHARLDERGRRRVLPWFAIGGLGFVLILLGCLLVAIGAARS